MAKTLGKGFEQGNMEIALETRPSDGTIAKSTRGNRDDTKDVLLPVPLDIHDKLKEQGDGAMAALLTGLMRVGLQYLEENDLVMKIKHK